MVRRGDHASRRAGVLVAALFVAACGAATPPTPAATAPVAPVSSPSAGIAGAGLALAPPDVLDLAAFAAFEDEQIADTDARAGAVERFGPAVVAGLADQRHQALGALVDKATGRASQRVASLADLGPTAAVGDLAGGSLVGLTALVSQLISSRSTTGSANNSNGEIDTTSDVTLDGRPATVRSRGQLQVTGSGSRLTGTATIQLDATIRAADGSTIGTYALTSTGQVEIDMCPDAAGVVAGGYDLTIAVTATGVAGQPGTANFRAHGTVRGDVGDDAFLHGYTIDGAADVSATSASGASVDRAVQIQAGYVLTGSPGNTGSISVGPDPTGSVVRADDAATDADLTALYQSALNPGIFVGTLMFAAAQEKWRGGSCVAVEATEQSRDVAPDELVHFTATVKHVVEGSQLDKPIVAAFSGEKSVIPRDQPLDPPADLTYTAPTQPGKSGTVTLTSTSNRGIGTLGITFTVAPPIVIELEIESTSVPTKLSGFLVTRGSAKATGRIRLERLTPTEWAGEGTLASTTTSGAAGCQQVRVHGQGVYDWRVFSAIVGPDVAQADIVVDMDAGSISESPDAFEANACQTILTGTMNTWENIFFTVYRQRYGQRGFHLAGDWISVATADTWKTGGKIASLDWDGSCAPNLGPYEKLTIACSNKTTFTLWAVVP